MSPTEHLAQADGVVALLKVGMAAANDLPPHHRLSVLMATLDDLLDELRPAVVSDDTARAITDLAFAAHDAALVVTAEIAVAEMRASGREPPGRLLAVAAALRARVRNRLAKLPHSTT